MTGHRQGRPPSDIWSELKNHEAHATWGICGSCEMTVRHHTKPSRVKAHLKKCKKFLAKIAGTAARPTWLDETEAKGAIPRKMSSSMRQPHRQSAAAVAVVKGEHMDGVPPRKRPRPTDEGGDDGDEEGDSNDSNESPRSTQYLLHDMSLSTRACLDVQRWRAELGDRYFAAVDLLTDTGMARAYLVVAVDDRLGWLQWKLQPRAASSTLV
ncbi:Aste57867_15326 [Aphanomyces stellatus]|uniref:Aste57867_15326 protein n=1 Tax=Aphanomyces stellatus TaxID=120398 RepID=A0A485L4R2_9STRA|nr:hypothetical protein As57867_015270 [Aphanomyces stellatus]VFT92135.1 Aste57867_15326 [Aphanomyces stellatus]